MVSREKSDARCCGIVGYIGTGNVEPVLMEGIEILQNRGYDSCGMTTIGEDGQLITTKFASRGSTSDCIQLLKKEAPTHHGGHHIGIAHTRWATHGAKTDTNAHPHMDWKKRISLVHNGTIDNFAQLKKDLLAKGCVFMTETDSEVIANLIGYKLDLGLSFEDAVTESVSQLQGTWGLCVIHKDYPDRIVLARNGSPLLVGSSDGQVFIASEPAALARHTSQYLMLQDGEIAIVTSKGIDQLLESRDMHRIAAETVETSPDPFPHWTLKEIFEQPQSLARALNYGGRIMAHGETLDTIRACQIADEHAVRKFSIVNSVGSLLARMTSCGVYLNAGREVAVASTKAFTSQVTVLALVSSWFWQNLRSEEYPDRCNALLDALHRLPVYAGALKIKEISYIHAEGFAGGALKHGPFALIDDKAHTPVIMIVLGDQHAALMLNAAQQVKARGAYLICVTDYPELVQDVADDYIVIPSNGPLTALLAAIPLQLLAYELSVARGINPDKPRGLAKTVTVS
ncbi:glucosamine--fructose-6-phosphate aminotransferase (isomerizing), putative [Eimeria mitis]|uniref:Glutamine--fructose-6-phosphate aminotransferase [isomerizing] n=1 Tax=Eimeria mitis TaxID=44415 RepID=U6JQC5_9EIME|nr:glucosamine--fructose-6-phosphate aminotransferase (isomerizing), putative [Eimeria mitis]CDJ27056.1 glucosamine--fructose-6-phosphate aminotransferase (isomerizing), putative [Eimeria mitis]